MYGKVQKVDSWAVGCTNCQILHCWNTLLFFFEVYVVNILIFKIHAHAYMIYPTTGPVEETKYDLTYRASKQPKEDHIAQENERRKSA